MNKKSNSRQRPQRDNRPATSTQRSRPETERPRVGGGPRSPAFTGSQQIEPRRSGPQRGAGPKYGAGPSRGPSGSTGADRSRPPRFDARSRPDAGARPTRAPRPQRSDDDFRDRRPAQDDYDADGADRTDSKPRERVIYGIGPVRELLAHFPQRIERLLIDERRGTSSAADPAMQIAHAASAAHVIVSSATRQELDAVTGPDARHQGVAAILGPFTYADLDDVIASITGTPLWIALDGVEDPGNLGAIIRTAYLLGAHGVIIPEHRAASVTAVTAKASAGASELLPIVKVGNLARALQMLKDSGVWTMALHSSEQSKPMAALDCKMPICIVLGAEGSGVRPLTAQSCDFHAVLPMVNAGVGSFNVSVAAAMALYEIVRQRA